MKNRKSSIVNHKSLIIGWLYPELMSTYGDRGNIIALQKRCEWRGINVNVLELNVNFNEADLTKCNLFMMGGAQDKQQEAVSKDLLNKKNILQQMVENQIPGIYICGAYQFLGKYYKETNGNIINGLGIFDLYTENAGEKTPRLIGNMVFENNIFGKIIGFENHGGRTYLGKSIKPFGKIITGFGNNGRDKTEGAIYKNSIGTYSHGPILPKNPKIADYLIKTALEIKYKSKIELEYLDETIEQKARLMIAKRLQITI
jgi:lipid II isoglutaminyl synthase (glutamine-hydrolysing)